MTDLTRGALAKELGLTPARISQLLTAGTLEGCYRGDGRQRRYDLEKVRVAYEINDAALDHMRDRSLP